jgi:CO/xanthine dehydrogenase FAD-binding subunit
MDEDIKIVDATQSVPFEIPPEGSLGLLALGAVAMKPWRKKRIECGYEEKLIERVKKEVEEVKQRQQEKKEKMEAAKLKKEQETKGQDG